MAGLTIATLERIRGADIMDRLMELLERVRRDKMAEGNLRGCLHVLIGRAIKTTEGEVVSIGNTWRDLSHHLKSAKFDKELVRELGVDPDEISPRDRERFWYSVIALAKPDSGESIGEAETFANKLTAIGYQVGPLPPGLSHISIESSAESKSKTKAKGKR